MQYMLHNVKNQLHELSLAVDVAKAFITDRNNNHEQRWELFNELDCLNQIPKNRHIYEGFNKLVENGGAEVFMYDGLVHCERYQTVCLISSIDTIMEQLLENVEPDDAVINEEGDYTLPPALAALERRLQDTLMQDFVSTFTYDW
jgi:hypothetical protein